MLIPFNLLFCFRIRDLSFRSKYFAMVDEFSSFASLDTRSKTISLVNCKISLTGSLELSAHSHELFLCLCEKSHTL